MTKAWNGLPDHPERSGWHWLKPHQDNYAVPFEWNPDEGLWEGDIDEGGFPEEMVDSGYQYLCPCPDPAEFSHLCKGKKGMVHFHHVNEKGDITIGMIRWHTVRGGCGLIGEFINSTSASELPDAPQH